jgi:PQQ-dependent dehydrogenase (methanol/ethanol family)
VNFKTVSRSIVAAILGASLTIGTAQTYEQLLDPPAGEWPQHGRDAQARRYSPLDQIDDSNVRDLNLSWARDLGFLQTMQGSPAVWDGVMYVSTQTGVLALDATNGDQVWVYSAPNEGEVISDSAVRGSPVVFESKVFFSTRYGQTVAVDAATGEELWSTQVTEEQLAQGFSTNPIFADGKLILGATGSDSGGSPGEIMALDVENGELLWTFTTVPLDPSDPAFDSWPNPPSWEAGIGGGSAWNAGAYDPQTNTVVYGTGQPTPWDRIDYRRFNEGDPMANLYTASFVALDADTGELKWYHQVVPGDEWDLDQHTVPIFADIEIDGSERRVALLATTTGYIVVVDAESGEFIAGHGIAEERTIHLGYDDEGKAIIDPDVRFADTGQFERICPGLRWAHIAPGAFSPDTGLIYRPNQMHCINMGARLLPADWQPGERAWFSETGPKDESFWLDRLGALSAIDPVTGEVVWEFSHYYGHDAGPVVTAGNLVFTSSHDRRLRALNATTGEVLWEQALTAGSRGGTISYAVDGKQYIATLVGLSNVGTGDIPDYDPTAGILEPVKGDAAIFVFALD